MCIVCKYRGWEQCLTVSDRHLSKIKMNGDQIVVSETCQGTENPAVS